MLIFHTTVKYAGVSIQHLLSLGSGSPAETLSICNWVLCWINQQFIFFTKITSSPLTQIYINNLCQITCQGKTYKILRCHPVTLNPVFHFFHFSSLYTRNTEKPLFKTLQASNHRWPLGFVTHNLTFDMKYEGGGGWWGGVVPSLPMKSHCSVSGCDSKFLQNEISRMEWNRWIKELLIYFPKELQHSRSWLGLNTKKRWLRKREYF